LIVEDGERGARDDGGEEWDGAYPSVAGAG
jgi:hypothetical protein